jgi:hypothetical protein
MIAGAGGAPSEGVIHSLLRNSEFEIFGMGSDITDLVSSRAPIKKLVPYATEVEYEKSLISILDDVKPDFIHFQNDLEIYEASKIRNIFDERGIKYFMPNHDVIDTCVHKYKSYLAFSSAGIKVPRNLLISTESDLTTSFLELGDENGKIWLRSSAIGGGGKGSLSTSNLDFAKAWITANNGWGTFLAAQMLTKDTVTWQSIWHQGELVVAQTRKRSGWVHGNRSISGITGVTKIGTTMSDEMVDQIAIESVYAVDKAPHGIYGVDMAYDKHGIPNPTEINIARFFTTIRFFTDCGLNMPEIYVQLGLGLKVRDIPQKLNPLPNNLSWLRGMDREPILISGEDLKSFEAEVK